MNSILVLRATRACELSLHPAGNMEYVPVPQAAPCRQMVLLDVDITLWDGVEGGRVAATGLRTQEEGWKTASGLQNGELRMLVTRRSASSQLFSREGEDTAVAASCSSSEEPGRVAP